MVTLVILDKKAWGKDLKAGQGYGPGSAAPIQSIGDKLAAKVTAEAQKLTAQANKPKTTPKGKGKGKPVKGRGIGTSPASGLTIKGWRFGDEVVSIEKDNPEGINQYTGGQGFSGAKGTGDAHYHSHAIGKFKSPIMHFHYSKLSNGQHTPHHDNVPEQHRMRVEHQTAAMPPAMRGVMGGGVQKYSDDEARDDHGMWTGDGGGSSSGGSGGSKAKAPSMTSRDYRHLADGVARSPLDDKTKAEFAAHLASSLYKTNPRFDGARFAAAAKGTPNKPGDAPRGRDYRSGSGMTRQNFKLVADAIKTFPLKDENTRAGLADHFAGHLGQTNPRFDRSKFTAAAITKYEIVQLIEKGDLPGHEFHGNQWSTFAGGIGSPNKFSYTKNDARGGQYHVNPVTSSTGRHQGYSLTRSAGPHPSEGPGLWRTIDAKGNEKSFSGHEPAFRSPQAAKSAAKLHESRMMAPQPGKTYQLTGGTGDKALSNGNSWADSEVKR